MNQRHRNYCFTIWEEIEIKEKDYDYMIYGTEVCPKTKRTHYQGYIEFNNGLSMSQVKKRFNDNSMHLEVRKGSQKQAIEYCKKDGKFVEFGKKKEQGERTDLRKIADSLLSRDKTLDEIMIEEPELYARYRGGLKDLAGLGLKQASKEFRKVKVNVHYGEAGTGKTRSVIENCTEDYYILDMASDTQVWFDGYNGEKNLIIDDFYGWIKYGQLLRLLDGYQCRLQIKGGFSYALWENVYITSNKHPSDWYERGMTPALKRRLNDILYYDVDGSTHKWSGNTNGPL